MTEVLDPRRLNRATLARQHLLERVPAAAIDVIERLGGMQSQAPLAPYVGLWTRLRDFAPEELATLTEQRRVVRLHLMRNTVHLVSARDALDWYALFHPMHAAQYSGHFPGGTGGVDRAELLDYGRRLLDERPRTRAELARLLGPRWPEADAGDLAHAVTHHLALCQVPPRGVWGRTGPAAWAPVETWLGAPLGAPPVERLGAPPVKELGTTPVERLGAPPVKELGTTPVERLGAPPVKELGTTPVERLGAPPVEELGAPPVERLALRYLAAFGPASIADLQLWSGLTRLAGVVRGLPLRRFRTEAGQILYDLPDAPRPAGDTPAPPRFLPEYDNLLLSYKDRSRFILDRRAVPLPPGNGATGGTFLIDGTWQGTWRVRDRTLHIEPFTILGAADRDELLAEAARLCTFLGADREIVLG